MKKLLLTIAICLLASPAFAFPSTGILDSFNGGNESPVTTNWTDDLSTAFAQFGIRLNNNALASINGIGSPGSAWYDLATFGPDSEAYFAIPSVTGLTFVCAALRAQTPGTAGLDGYLACAIGTTATRVFRVVNDGLTQLGSDVATTWAAGDSLGAEVTGVGATVTIKVYRKPAAGAWGVIETETDTDANRIVSAGPLGVYIDGTAGTGFVDNFGGGTMIAGGARRPPVIFK